MIRFFRFDSYVAFIWSLTHLKLSPHFAGLIWKLNKTVADRPHIHTKDSHEFEDGAVIHTIGNFYPHNWETASCDHFNTMKIQYLQRFRSEADQCFRHR